MHQVIGAQVRRDRIKRGQRSGGTLDLGDGDGPIECNDRRRHDRVELIVQGDDLRPVGCLKRVGGTVHGLDRGPRGDASLMEQPP
jgi:hypothetical protein